VQKYSFSGNELTLLNVTLK